MSILCGKKIVLAVTGGIAAYKSAQLTRLFSKAGAQVQVIMTPAAKDFVTPLTLSTLSKLPVYSTFQNEDSDEVTWNNHVEIALWADYIVIAPATSNTMSKMVNGTCDNLVLAVYMSAKCPVYIAPAMDLDMYKHPSTVSNLQKLSSFGNKIIPAEKGELASGLEGEGRMAEPENILKFIEKDIVSQLSLYGKKVLITAGPTFEKIDPVRFIGNHSTGKMGFDLAERASLLGAEVVLVSGPTHLSLKSKNINLIRVQTADEMYSACLEHFCNSSIFISAAAVADYKPKNVSSQKIKKSDSEFTIELIKNIDVLLTLSQQKKEQYVVGFALETENEIENAKSKIVKKNLDLIVLNSLNDNGAGFGCPTNKITLIDKNFEISNYDLKSKEEVAIDIFNKILEKNKF